MSTRQKHLNPGAWRHVAVLWWRKSRIGKEPDVECLIKMCDNDSQGKQGAIVKASVWLKEADVCASFCRRETKQGKELESPRGLYTERQVHVSRLDQTKNVLKHDFWHFSCSSYHSSAKFELFDAMTHYDWQLILACDWSSTYICGTSAL